MARFYVPDPRIEDGRLRVTGEEVGHIRKVLRLRVGDRLSVFDGHSKEYQGSIVEEGSSFVLIQIEKTLSPQRESSLEIDLAQSLLKGEKMDYVIQKATELGAREIVPFLSSRSVPIPDKSGRSKRHRRWGRIAVEASKQCGREVVPRVLALQDYSEMIRSASPAGLRVILWEREGKRLKEILKTLEGKRAIFFVAGPEGGFSSEEVQLAEENGFIPVTLGRRILRAETASLCLLSILQYELGDIG
jgi:16S rRNA (uracil1498-N3)-methyltransferase